MPEGDTIHRAAARLRPALEGKTVVAFTARRTPPPHPRRGERVQSVEAEGKHLLIRFSGGLVLHTHMGMSGSWHLYATGQRWRQPQHLARAVIETDDHVAVCFAAPTVRLTTEPRTTHLGPDLCEPDADLDACVERMTTMASPDDTLADVLLDQRICAGVGNVFKSEVCFACRLHPLTPIAEVNEQQRRQVVQTASQMLRAGLTGPRPNNVYGRARRPCRRCGTPITSERTGPHLRSTYWCPRCQPASPR